MDCENIVDVSKPPSSYQSEVPIKLTRSYLSTTFRQKWFSFTSDTEWNNWTWQLTHRISTAEQLDKMFRLSDAERLVLEDTSYTLPISITPYYASLMDPEDSSDPIRRCMVPTIYETIKSRGEEEDPLHEASQSPTPTLVHRYPDRVLFLTTNMCSNFCRFCTRSRMVGDSHGIQAKNKDRWIQNIKYIKDHPEVRDVLLSGGDPLMLSDGEIDWLLREIRAIPHVEIIRIGTKMPIVCPQRITSRLIGILKRYHPLWISIHCTHPAELTETSSEALQALADAGIPLGSQTVLLSGINDEVEILKKLFHKLMINRVKPYYLYSCDPIIGSKHFRTSVKKGIKLIKGLRGFTTGYAVPTYVIDAPGGGGKIPVTQDNIVYEDEKVIAIRNYEGKTFTYPLE
jgi:lysine 2,3-aminomutase